MVYKVLPRQNKYYKSDRPAKISNGWQSQPAVPFPALPTTIPLRSSLRKSVLRMRTYLNRSVVLIVAEAMRADASSEALSGAFTQELPGAGHSILSWV